MKTKCPSCNHVHDAEEFPVFKIDDRVTIAHKTGIWKVEEVSSDYRIYTVTCETHNHATHKTGGYNLKPCTMEDLALQIFLRLKYEGFKKFKGDLDA